MTNAHQQIKEALTGMIQYVDEHDGAGQDIMAYRKSEKALKLLDDCIIINKSDIPEGFMDKFLNMLETQKRVTSLERELAEQMEDKNDDTLLEN